MEKNGKVNSGLKDKVLEVRLTKLEASLIKKIRELEYGKISLMVHKIEGQPIRVEIIELSQSCILSARDGLDLEDAVYVSDFNKIN